MSNISANLREPIKSAHPYLVLAAIALSVCWVHCYSGGMPLLGSSTLRSDLESSIMAYFEARGDLLWSPFRRVVQEEKKSSGSTLEYNKRSRSDEIDFKKKPTFKNDYETDDDSFHVVIIGKTFSGSMFAPSLAIGKTYLELCKTSASTWPDFENTIFRQCESFDLIKHVATAVHAALSSDSGWPDFDESSSPDSEDIETGDKPDHDDDSLQSPYRRRRVTRKERKTEPYKWSTTTKKKPPDLVDPASSHLEENIAPAEVDSLEPAGCGVSLKTESFSGHSKQKMSPHRDIDF